MIFKRVPLEIYLYNVKVIAPRSSCFMNSTTAHLKAENLPYNFIETPTASFRFNKKLYSNL